MNSKPKNMIVDLKKNFQPKLDGFYHGVLLIQFASKRETRKRGSFLKTWEKYKFFKKWEKREIVKRV